MAKLLFEKISNYDYWTEDRRKAAYDNLRVHIDEFKNLAKIKNWKTISDNVIVYTKLQEAYDIMLGKETKTSHAFRCRPCERMALACIKDLVGDDNYEPLSMGSESSHWEAEEWEIKEQLEILDFTQEDLDKAIDQANKNAIAFQEIRRPIDPSKLYKEEE